MAHAVNDSVSGVVTSGGAPVAGVTVSIDPVLNTSPVTATTGAAGDYSIATSPGFHNIQFVLGSYTSSMQIVNVNGPTTFNFDIPANGTISGTVAENGAPVAGALVSIDNGFRSAFTSSDGKYSFNLLTGSHFVALDAAYSGYFIDATVYPAQYVNVTSNSTTSHDIPVTRGGKVTVNPILLPNSTTGYGFSVAICRTNVAASICSPINSSSAPLTSNALAAGDYVISVSTYNSPPSVFPLTPVTITPNNTVLVSIQAEIPATLTGKVSGSNAAIVSAGTISVCDTSRTVCSWGSIAADGTYLVPGLRGGTVVVGVYPYTNFIPLLNQPLTVIPSTPNTHDFVLQPGASITGKVTFGGSPLGYYPVDACLVTDRQNCIGHGYSVSDGSYLIQGLPAGDYVVQVKENRRRYGSTLASVSAAQSITGADIVVYGDADGDTIDDHTESLAPNSGDGNGDGIPDAQQPNVASALGNKGDYVTAESRTGTVVQPNYVSLGSLTFPNLLTPFDAFNISVSSGTSPVAPGALETLKVYLPSKATAFQTYDRTSATWSALTFDGVTGPQFSGKVMTITAIDGGRGEVTPVNAPGVVEFSGVPTRSAVVAPVVTITKGPKPTLTDDNARFVFSSDQTGTTFLCSLDVRTAKPCTSPTTYHDIKLGTHTFTVTGDNNGVNSAPATYSWTRTKESRDQR